MATAFMHRSNTWKHRKSILLLSALRFSLVHKFCTAQLNPQPLRTTIDTCSPNLFAPLTHPARALYTGQKTMMTQDEYDGRPLKEIGGYSEPWVSFPLVSKKTLVNGDPARQIYPIRLFTFGYPSTKSLSFTFTTQVLKLVRSDTLGHKSYSPTSEAYDKGKIELTIRVYPGGGHSEWLDKQPIGTWIKMFGPIPPPNSPRAKVYTPGKRVVAIGLGLGITEVFTTCREELRKNNQTKVSLVYSVRYKDEIVLTEELEQLVKQFPQNFDVTYVTTRQIVNQKGWLNGRLDAATIQNIIGHQVPREDVKILVVGTKPMMRAVWEKLEQVGYEYEKTTLVRKSAPPYF